MTHGMALDVFTIQDAAGGPFDSGDKIARLSVMIERTLSGTLHPRRELAGRSRSLPSRTRVFTVPPRVLIDNRASTTHTVIEINGRDRPGLLYDLTRALTALTLQISTAKISTYGAKAIDVFYVKDVFGLKIIHENKLMQIREALLKALADPSGKETASGSNPAAERRARPRKPAPRRVKAAADAAE
jgi:[protein-PII] uridylyltransferase